MKFRIIIESYFLLVLVIAAVVRRLLLRDSPFDLYLSITLLLLYLGFVMIGTRRYVQSFAITGDQVTLIYLTQYLARKTFTVPLAQIDRLTYDTKSGILLPFLKKDWLTIADKNRNKTDFRIYRNTLAPETLQEIRSLSARINSRS